MSGCLWGNWHKFTDKQREGLTKMLKRLDEEEKKEMGKKGAKCPVCWGRGEAYPENGNPKTDMEVCEMCNGTGYQEKEDKDGLRLGRE